jgi:ribosomal protein L14
MKKEKKIKVKKEKKVPVQEYELVTFGVKATIPTQQYGNIMPEVVIKTKTIEEAKEIVMPVIEELYLKYAEHPRDGSKVSFMNKANVIVEEKKVEVSKPITKAPVIEKEEKTLTGTPEERAQNLADDLGEKSQAFIKARTAIKSSMSLDALDLIEAQIHKSVKLTVDEKPELLTEVLRKRKEFE